MIKARGFRVHFAAADRDAVVDDASLRLACGRASSFWPTY